MTIPRGQPLDDDVQFGMRLFVHKPECSSREQRSHGIGRSTTGVRCRGVSGNVVLALSVTV